MSQEHREHHRFPVAVSAEIFVGTRVFQATTENLSRGGVGVQTIARLEEKQTVNVTLFLTEDGIESADEEPFETKAQVRWVAERDDGRVAAGLQFAPANRVQAAHLERFLARLGQS